MDWPKLRKTANEVCGLTFDAPVLVGLSGGPDSLFLLLGLVELGFPVIAAHFDHQLRSESAEDAEAVRRMADRLGVPVVVGRGAVAHCAAVEHRSIEEAARMLRYRFLFEQARLAGAQAVAVGHTADDQVETVLMHLLRGAGLSGLQGMRWRTVLPDWDEQMPLVRPLLDTWRAETLAGCLAAGRERGLEPLIDPTNAETSFFRNRIRHDLVPFLETFNPRVRENLWRTAQLLAGDAAIVQTAVEQAWESCRPAHQDGSVTLDLTALRSLPPGLQRGVLRRGVAELLPFLPDLDYAAVERVVHFIQPPAGGQVDLVQGLRVFAENNRLWITGISEPPANLDWPQLADEELIVPVPGQVDLPRGWQLESAWFERADFPDFAAPGDWRWEAWLDADGLPEPLCLRRPRPGDRFQPLGMDGRSIKLSDLWVNQKLPRRARAAWPLLCGAGTILWVPGFRSAHPGRLMAESRRAVRITLKRSE